MASIRISVVVPTLNEAQIIGTTLAETCALGFDEVVVVDGGSTDGTVEIVAAHAARVRDTRGEVRGVFAPNSQPGTPHPVPCTPTPVSFLASQPGRAIQMNAGAAATTGDLLVFLHADSRLPAGARGDIEEAVRDPTCVGGRFDVRFDRDCVLGRVIAFMMNARSRWTGIATGDQAIFARRSVFDRLGGYAGIPLMEDVDLTWRLKRTGRLAALHAQVVTSFRRWETKGPLRSILLMWGLRFLYWVGVSPARLARWYRTVR